MTSIMSDVIAGRIALLDPLARGASGSLWRAIDLRYGAVCAAKVMRQRDGAEVLRFVREQTVGSAQGLGQHPHLLPPYTWAAEDDTIVLVMPLVHGGTLASALAEHGPLSPSLVAQLLRQLLDALAAMHAAHWVHRDVKPANLLLNATGAAAPHLLLADFGIALHESDVRLTETGFAHGTPGYMAPEVLAGAGTSTAQDVWAAAACALEALSPAPPRQRYAPHELLPRLEELLAGHPDPAARPLGDLLRTMLDPEETARPTAAQARDRIPPPSTPAATWSRTADGRPVVLGDRIPSADGRPEVPLDGPGSLAGLAPGLHERLSASADAEAPTAPSSAASAGPAPAGSAGLATADSAPPAATSPTAPAPHGTTERFVHAPTWPQQAPSPAPGAPSPGAPSAGASPAPSWGPDPAGAPTAPAQPPPGPRRGASLWTGVSLLAISVLSLGGAAGLLWAALG